MNIYSTSYNQNYSNYNNKSLNFKANLSSDSDDFFQKDELEKSMKTKFKEINSTYSVIKIQDNNFDDCYNIRCNGKKLFRRYANNEINYNFYDPAFIINEDLEKQLKVGPYVHEALFQPWDRRL